MRRTLLAAVAVVLAGALGAATLAAVGAPPRTAGSGAATTADPGGPAAAESGPFALAAERARTRRGAGLHEAASDRGRAARAMRRAQQQPVLRRRSGMVDPRMAEQVVQDLADRLDVEEERMRSALASVGRDTLSRSELADRRRWDVVKREALAELASELGRPVGDVASAARNELEAKLDRGVTFGAVTSAGRALALRCFDAPERCDVPALRRTLRLDRRGPR